jgi:hypothetical protein
MPKIAKPLNDLQVRRITRVGWHAVGGVAGLLLQVRKPAKEGAQAPRSWILRVKVGDQRQPIGLGSYPQVSLAVAREQAGKLAIEAKQGVNLKAKKHAQRSSLIAAAEQDFQGMCRGIHGGAQQRLLQRQTPQAVACNA